MAGALAIKDLKVWPLREPVSGRRYTVLRLDTESGLKGYGECRETSPRELGAARSALSGIDVTAYEIGWRKLSASPGVRPAIQQAMLDISGQLSKAPVYQVLGGPTRNKARGLAVLEGPAALERAQKSGFKAFSVAVPKPDWRNGGQAFVQAVSSLMQRMRRASGSDADFVLDGGGGLVPGDAQQIAAAIERFHLLWFDEPTAVSNLGAVKKIASENVTPLGFGRTVREPGGFQDLLREDSVDILRPDLAIHGISQIRRIAALAETYYTAVAPYHDGGPVGTAAALHLAASLPNFFIQQIPQPGNPKDQELRKAIAGDIEKVTGGFAALPTGPGLGIKVNEDALDRYQERA